MLKRAYIILVLSLGLIVSLAAGDVASYVNLGFSINSRYFLFGYYGIDDTSSQTLFGTLPR